MDRINSSNLTKYQGFSPGKPLQGYSKPSQPCGDVFVSDSKEKTSQDLISPDILKKHSIPSPSTGENAVTETSADVPINSLNNTETKGSSKSAGIYEPNLYKRFTARTKHMLQQFLAVTMLAGALTAGPVSAAASSFRGEDNRPVAERVEGADGSGFGSSLRTLTEKGKALADKAEEITDRLEDANKFQRKIGDYDLKVKFMDPSIKVKPRLNPRIKDGEVELKGKAYIKAEMDLLSTELSKQEQQGDWIVTKGFRGKIDSEYQLGHAGKYSASKGLFDEEKIDDLDISAHLHGFMQWDRDLSENVHLKLGVAAGVSHNILDDETTLSVKGEQKLTGTRVQIFGQDFRWVAEAEEEIKYNIQNDRIDMEYEMVAGLQKKIPVRVMGKKIDIDFTIGPGIKGDTENAINFKPMAKLKALF